MDMSKAVAAAASDYLTDKLRARDVAHANLNDEMLIIVKGTSLVEFEEQMRENMKHRVSASVAFKDDPNAQQQAEGEEGFRDLVLTSSEEKNISGEQEISLMKSFLQELGRKYPVVTTKGTEITVGYYGSVHLDMTDPAFFDQLDAVIEHLLTHDDLKAFPSPT